MFRTEREAHGIELAEMARGLDISPLYLERVEQGEADPPATLWIRYVQALGTTWTELIQTGSS